jgi:hypothetical protein
MSDLFGKGKEDTDPIEVQIKKMLDFPSSLDFSSLETVRPEEWK